MNPASTTPASSARPAARDVSAKSWLTEAPLRMLMNNLDPEVAEKPGELVVYGGIGRAARDWESFDRIVASLRRLEADETLLRAVRQAGRRLPHPRRRAARADRQFQPRAALGDAGSFQRARSQGPDDVRPDDGRLVDLHRHPGHRAGHLRDLRRGRPAALRRQPRGQVDPDRRPRRHGRRAAAGRDHGRRLDARGRMPAEPHRDAAAHRLSRRAGERRSTRRSTIIERGRRRARSRSRSACSATPPRCFPSWCAAACGPTSSPTRPRAHDPINGYLPKGWTLARMGGASARSDPKAVETAAKHIDGGHVQAMLDFHAPGVPTLDYGNNIRQMAKEKGVAERLRFPGLRAGLHPSAVLPRHRPVPLGGAVGRSGGHLPHRRQGEGADARRHASAQLARHGAGAHQVPGPAGAHLLGRPRRPPPARPRLQRDGGEAAN